MTINSLDFKTVLNEFDHKLYDVFDAILDAVAGELDADEMKDAVQAAKGRLTAYDQLIARDDLGDLKRKQVTDMYEDTLSSIRDCLGKLEGNTQ
ncbi:MAG: hypothetical protein P1P84_08425 [Deferrisomatales bacterium]|nr:hypothetical protein [Deferrisomatales bacterium]